MKAALLLFVAALLPAEGQHRIREIDAMFRWVQPDMPGCVVAVSLHGKLVAHRAYGSADLEREVPLTTDSVFDVGSLRKQFIAAAILLLVEEGKLTLADGIRKHIPELPDTVDQITVDHLLTHTSGIRDWTGIARLSSKDEDALTMILRQRGLNFAPGEEWSYSNSGYVLLAELIRRKSGTSLSAFLQKRLFDPLKMKSTRYVEDMRSDIKNRALAYEKQGGSWKPDMLLDNDRGGGGALFATASDLILWNEALTGGRLGQTVTEKLQEPARLNNGRKLDYARGLLLDINRGGRVVWHSGGAAGYKSMLARYPEQGLSLAILCNGGDGADGRRFARPLYDLFVPDSVTAVATDATPPPVEAKDVDLDGKAGLFLDEDTGDSLRLMVRGGKLMVAGGPPLVAVAEDRFRNPEGNLRFRSQDEFELRFHSSDELELRSMEGKTTRYRRVERHAPTPAELKSLEGRYESREIGAVFRIAVAGPGLLVQLEHDPKIRLRFGPIARDTFQQGPLSMRFRRDEAGAVTTFAFSNPVLRSVEFTRLSDPVPDGKSG